MAAKPLVVRFTTQGFEDLRKQMADVSKTFQGTLNDARAASQKAIADAKAAAGDVKLLEKAQLDFERAAKKANGAVAGSFRELRVKSVADLEAQRAAAKSAFDAIKNSGTASYKDVAAAQKALTARTKELDQQLNEHAQGWDKVKVMGSNALDALKTKFTTLDVGVRSTNEGFTIMKGVLANLISGGIQAGLSAIANGIKGIVGGLIGLGKQGVGVFMQFDGAMKAFAAKSGGATAEQIKAVREEAERLGMATSKTPTEIAQMAASLAAAGFTAEQTKQAMNGIVLASEASGESLQTAGDIVGAALNQFRLGADQSGRVADVLTAAANGSAASISSLGEGLKFIGPIAGSSNQSIEDMAVAIGLLTNAGLEGGMAGRNLTSAFERLQKASAGVTDGTVDGTATLKAQQAALQTLGVEFRQADGQMRPLLEVLPELNEAFKRLDYGERDLIRTRLFGSEGGRAINSLLGQVDTKLQGLEQTVKNAGGAAAETSAELQKGLNPALERMASSWEILIGKFGKALASSLEFIVITTTEWINELAKTEGLFAGIAGISEQIKAFFEANPAIIEEINAQMTALVQDALQSASDLAGEMLDYIKQNPAIITDIIRGFGQLVGGSLKLAAGLAQSLLGYLQQNPKTIDDAISAMGSMLTILGKLTEGAIAFGKAIGDAMEGWTFMMSPEKTMRKQVEAVFGSAGGDKFDRMFYAQFQEAIKKRERQIMGSVGTLEQRNIAEAVAMEVVQELLAFGTTRYGLVAGGQEVTAATNPNFVWGKTGGATTQDPFTRGRSTGAHLHSQSTTGKLGESEIRAVMDEFVRVDGKKPSSFGESRASAGHGYTAIDYLTPQGSNITLLGGATLELYHKGGGNGGLMAKLITPKGTLELGHLMQLNPPSSVPSSSTAIASSGGGGGGGSPQSTTPSATPVATATPGKTVKAPKIQYWAEIVAAANEYGIDPYLYAGLVAKESTFNPNIKSPAGATGLAQLMPGTARDMGVKNILDPVQNLRGGAKYLKQLMGQFGSAELALAAYNAGPGNVQKYKGIPPFKETQEYVPLVLSYAEEYRGSAGQSQSRTIAQAVSRESKEAEKEAKEIRDSARKLADADTKRRNDEEIAKLKEKHAKIQHELKLQNASAYAIQRAGSVEAMELQELQTEQAIAELEKQRKEKLAAMGAGGTQQIPYADRDITAEISKLQADDLRRRRGIVRDAELDVQKEQARLNNLAIAETRGISELEIQMEQQALDLARERGEITGAQLINQQAMLDAARLELQVTELMTKLEAGLIPADEINATNRKIEALEAESLYVQKVAGLRIKTLKAEEESNKKERERARIQQEINLAQAEGNHAKVRDLEIIAAHVDFERERLEILQKIADEEEQIAAIKLAEAERDGRIRKAESAFIDSRLSDEEAIRAGQSALAEQKANLAWNPYESNRLRRENAEANARLQSERTLFSIQEKYGEFSPIGMQLASMEQERLNLELDELGREFQTLEQKLATDVSNAFGGFIQALLNGENALEAFAKSLVEIFSNIGQQLIQSGANGLFGNMFQPGSAIPASAGGRALNFATSSPLQSFGSQAASAGLQAATSAATGLFGGFLKLPFFKNGGEITPFQQSVSHAFKKEGPGAQLAVVHAGEHVLSDYTGEAQRYRKLESKYGGNPLSKILNYALGGSVKGGNSSSSFAKAIANYAYGGMIRNNKINQQFKEAANGQDPLEVRNMALTKAFRERERQRITERELQERLTAIESNFINYQVESYKSSQQSASTSKESDSKQYFQQYVASLKEVNGKGQSSLSKTISHSLNNALQSNGTTNSILANYLNTSNAQNPSVNKSLNESLNNAISAIANSSNSSSSQAFSKSLNSAFSSLSSSSNSALSNYFGGASSSTLLNNLPAEQRLLSGLNSVARMPQLSIPNQSSTTTQTMGNSVNTVNVNINDKSSRFYTQSRTLARDLADQLRG